MHWETKIIVSFTFLQQSGSKPAVSLRPVCTPSPWQLALVSFSLSFSLIKFLLFSTRTTCIRWRPSSPTATTTSPPAPLPHTSPQRSIQRQVSWLPLRLAQVTQKRIVWGVTRADKARVFIGKEHPGGEQYDKGAQEGSDMWLTDSGFPVMGLVSELSLANCSDSGSFLVAHTLLS